MHYTSEGEICNCDGMGGSSAMFPAGSFTTTLSRMVGVPICPDLLSIDTLGEADTWRGHVVRGMFQGLAVIDRIIERWPSTLPVDNP